MQLKRSNLAVVAVVAALAITAFAYLMSSGGPNTSGSDLQPTLAELKATLGQLEGTLKGVAGVTSALVENVQTTNAAMQERTGREIERDSHQQQDMAELTSAIDRLAAVVDKMHEEERWKK